MPHMRHAKLFEAYLETLSPAALAEILVANKNKAHACYTLGASSQAAAANDLSKTISDGFEKILPHDLKKLERILESTKN